MINHVESRLRDDVESLSRGRPSDEEKAILTGLPLGEVAARLVADQTNGPRAAVMSLYVVGATVRLSRILPILHGLGAEVIDEFPIDIVRDDGILCRIYRFSIELSAQVADDPLRDRFIDAVLAVWHGHSESDRLNALVVEAGLTWSEVAVVRAYARYLRQTRLPIGLERIESVLRENAPVAAALFDLFKLRHDPTLQNDAEAITSVRTQIEAAIEHVTSLDADRILRAYLAMIMHTSRTNHFTDTEAALALKLEPTNLAFLPQPRPRFEIFVYSPRIEGVHLRFGSVARGGIRWSDRPDDFRTEILALAKAQAVKNAVIVPMGAKGGFVVKHAPLPTGDTAADQRRLHAEAVACYRQFISALLSVTDNRDPGTGRIVPPANVVRHDDDDSYLVVAADKGTATFSDLANAVAIEKNFWLGDAFASGGSTGYDHKAMGITARGAWESVTRHFRELGADAQSDDFTVVGIGDMSGDVFGNGMLLSRHIRLVAAFDHRHIFLDPNPDSGTSFSERARLFGLPRSSWMDYSADLLSPGGGVYSRAAKSIPVTTEVRELLALDSSVTLLPPDELIRHILRAPVSLLWNGGIGTYAKAGSEDHLSVADKTNDGVRVNAGELRCAVIGEGGNLGLTPRARIEFAERGGRINTDALDNSAGVDCSDHEVNIKVLLQPAVTAGELTLAERNQLLASMTAEVAQLVVANNFRQNETLGGNRTNASRAAKMQLRHISALADAGRLDRVLEVLPSSDDLARRPESARLLTSPELATLLAHIKLTLKAELLAGALIDDEYFEATLLQYFPATLRPRFNSAIAAHPLRREIIATAIANRVVDRGGITYVHRLFEEVGALGPDAVWAFYIAIEIFRLEDVWQHIREAGLPARLEDLLFIESSRVLDRATRWVLTHRPKRRPIAGEIARFAPSIAALRPNVPHWLSNEDNRITDLRSGALIADGVPSQLVGEVFGLLDLYGLLDVIEVANQTGDDVEEVGELYYAVKDRMSVNTLLMAVTALDRTDRWNSVARTALREELYGAVRAITTDVLQHNGAHDSIDRRLRAWEIDNATRLKEARTGLDALMTSPALSLAQLMVATRHIRALATAGRQES
ncbi:NAD-glutamate dehydrogenase domain-containing protein [Nocardia tengchongensis]